jgi:hypothetical protein
VRTYSWRKYSAWLSMSFEGLRSLLIHHVNRSVQAGEITERGLSRRVGISQPHIHNVLKGKRVLSWESADALLDALNLNLLDLINHYDDTE